MSLRYAILHFINKSRGKSYRLLFKEVDLLEMQQEILLTAVSFCNGRKEALSTALYALASVLSSA